jgi:hypothetical protein
VRLPYLQPSSPPLPSSSSSSSSSSKQSRPKENSSSNDLDLGENVQRESLAAATAADLSAGSTRLMVHLHKYAREHTPRGKTQKKSGGGTGSGISPGLQVTCAFCTSMLALLPPNFAAKPAPSGLLDTVMHEFVCCEEAPSAPMHSSLRVPSDSGEALLASAHLTLHPQTAASLGGPFKLSCKSAPSFLDMFTDAGGMSDVGGVGVGASVNKHLSPAAVVAAAVDMSTCSLSCRRCGNYVGDGQISCHDSNQAGLDVEELLATDEHFVLSDLSSLRLALHRVIVNWTWDTNWSDSSSSSSRSSSNSEVTTAALAALPPCMSGSGFLNSSPSVTAEQSLAQAMVRAAQVRRVFMVRLVLEGSLDLVRGSGTTTSTSSSGAPTTATASSFLDDSCPPILLRFSGAPNGLWASRRQLRQLGLITPKSNNSGDLDSEYLWVPCLRVGFVVQEKQQEQGSVTQSRLKQSHYGRTADVQVSVEERRTILASLRKRQDWFSGQLFSGMNTSFLQY